MTVFADWETLRSADVGTGMLTSPRVSEPGAGRSRAGASYNHLPGAFFRWICHMNRTAPYSLHLVFRLCSVGIQSSPVLLST